MEIFFLLLHSSAFSKASPITLTAILLHHHLPIKAALLHPSILSTSAIQIKEFRVERVMEAGESYYAVLGVSSDSSLDDIRRAYRRLAMQWHPDRWTRSPSLLAEANRKFQKIQEAYSVLSDPTKRAVYNAGLYDPTDEYDEGFCAFMQEMLDLMGQVKEEEKGCSLEELQHMFMETFNESAQWFSNPAPLNNHTCSATTSHWSSTSMSTQSSGMRFSDLGMFGTSSHCR